MGMVINSRDEDALNAVVITTNSNYSSKVKYTKIKLVLLQEEFYLFITPKLVSLFMDKFKYYFNNGVFIMKI